MLRGQFSSFCNPFIAIIFIVLLRQRLAYFLSRVGHLVFTVSPKTNIPKNHVVNDFVCSYITLYSKIIDWPSLW
uniref:Uncharacterized protein n=1 Tax=Octopus bimaculoides TaxID=37653 RepID=A0A0L8I7U2_OCTBM